MKSANGPIFWSGYGQWPSRLSGGAADAAVVFFGELNRAAGGELGEDGVHGDEHAVGVERLESVGCIEGAGFFVLGVGDDDDGTGLFTLAHATAEGVDEEHAADTGAAPVEVAGEAADQGRAEFGITREFFRQF
jgi:hypothetical protein